MEIPILLEPVENNGYRASSGPPFGLTAEGTTRDEAVAKVRELLDARMKSGAALVTMQLSSSPHPLARFAGMYSPDDPLVKQWLEIMAENRRKTDEDPDAP